MFSIFFIRRPIFATVISVVIVVIGLISLTGLPVSRYPEIAPPTIKVSGIYPGADARTVAETVATPIEQEVNGVEGMIYLSSVSANDGRMDLTVTFEPGTDLDIANVLVQNRIAIAEARLPEEVKRQGVTVSKVSSGVVMYIGLHSPGGTFDDQYLSNFVWQRVRDELARVNGVGSISIFGAGQLGMRIWLDPEKLGAFRLSVSDVIGAIRQQNVQVAGGRIGSSPAPKNTAFDFTVNVAGRLSEISEFENIIVRTDEDQGRIRVKDIARVELGSNTYGIASQLNGKPSTTLAIYQIPGSNIINVAQGVKDRLSELSQAFPEDLEYSIVYDNTNVVRASIGEVITTLIVALALVILTVFIFIQNFRATLIPALTIPVALIGTFAVLSVFGYSLNQLTLFGLVLVIGIVVDDAIVVVENTTRWISEGLSPPDAAEKAMREVSGPVIATTLVLLAVFVPTTAMSGITGTLFKQFAVTISIATVLSSINALTLSPALCALLLRKQEQVPSGVFRWFNTGLEATTTKYLGVTRFAIRKSAISVCLFILLAAVALLGLNRLPIGFVPQEDEGWCMLNVQLPDGASFDRTREAVSEINEIVASIPGVSEYLSISGYSIVDGSTASNTAFLLVTFNPWEDRSSPQLQQETIIATLNQRLFTYRKAFAFAFPMPSLPGIGNSGGFTFMLQDRSGSGLEQLQAMGNEIVRDGEAQKGLQGMNMTFRANIPQLLVNIDREQVMQTGTTLPAVYDTLQTYLGSAYVNDFSQFGRIYPVTAQADSSYRATPDDIGRLQLAGAGGDMISISALAEIEEVYGPQTVTRFNLYPSVKILGNAAEGFSSGDALQIMEDMAKEKLPDTMGYSWAELSFQEKIAAGSTSVVFLFAILMVYLFLAAQYESWTLPLSVLLAVPTALFGAVLAIAIRGYDNNVYTQIGIVLLIGLSTKSAILIVEFAKSLREDGCSILEAAIESTRLRFRAVLMTALSFVLGVVPLLFASGAGAQSQRVIGTAVFGGMIMATLISLAAVPMLYFVIQTASERFWPRTSTDQSTSQE